MVFSSLYQLNFRIIVFIPVPIFFYHSLVFQYISRVLSCKLCYHFPKFIFRLLITSITHLRMKCYECKCNMLIGNAYNANVYECSMTYAFGQGCHSVRIWLEVFPIFFLLFSSFSSLGVERNI